MSAFAVPRIDGRWAAVCTCGWVTGPLLTAMQAHEAAQDHVCKPAELEESGV